MNGQDHGPKLAPFIDAMMQLARAEFGARIHRSYKGDSIDVLGFLFNSLADELGTVFGDLERQRDEMRTLVDCMTEGLIVLDEAGHIQSLNRSLRVTLGTDSQAVVGQPVDALFGRDDLPGEGMTIARMIEQGEFRNVEKALRTSAGEEVPVLCSGSVMHDRSGEPAGAVCVLTDIREYKSAEKERALLVSAIETSMEAISIVTRDKTIVYTNEAMDRLFGYERGELQGMHIEDLGLAPPESAVLGEDLADIIQTHGHWTGEVFNTRKDGTTFLSRTRISAVSTPDGVVEHFISTQHDITAQRQAEEKLQQNERRFRRLFQDAPYLLFRQPIESAAHSDELQPRISESVEEITGYSAREFLDDPGLAPRIIHPEDQAVLAAIVSTPALLSSPVVIRFRHKNNEQRWMEVRFSEVTDEHGTTTAIEGIARDTTESMLAQREREQFVEQMLVAQDQERRRISRELHDEAGQWIGSMIAGLSTLEEMTDESAVKTAVSELRGLSAATLREIRRISKGLHPGILDSLGLSAALEHLATEATATHDVQVSCWVHGIQEGDRLPQALELTLYRIAQEALNNVVSHADARSASVYVTRNSSTVRLVIEDDGAGFPPDMVVRTRENRVGQGLRSIRERANLLDGDVYVESAPGQGTTLAVRIPLGERLK